MKTTMRGHDKTAGYKMAGGLEGSKSTKYAAVMKSGSKSGSKKGNSRGY